MATSSTHPGAVQCFLGLIILAVAIKGSLISSSEVQLCQRKSKSVDPVFSTGEACSMKFVVALAIRNGQGESNRIYADIKFVDNKTTTSVKKEQLRKPFRITVTKSDVHIHYPVTYKSSVNNQPIERYFTVHNTILGVNYCNANTHCEGLMGYCCASTHKERLSQAWEYKRAVASQVGHYFSHLYSHAVCMDQDKLFYNIFRVEPPYLTYKINVTVQQLDYNRRGADGKTTGVWSTVGFAEIGPEQIGQNTNTNQFAKTSSPQIKATWLGDFALNSHLAYFQSKYLLTPDWRLSGSAATNHDQVTGGSTEWLIVDRHIVDDGGTTCNRIGSDFQAFNGQENRCFQKQFSCFQVTTRKIWEKAKSLKKASINTHYFPPFYGDYLGPEYQEEKGEDGVPVDFQLVYRLNQLHKSLVTLIFTAESISFVQHVGNGRIVEALIEDFKALSGSGILTVTIQNTGSITADYSVSIGQCTEGIIRVAEQTKTIDPREQKVYNYEISASLNIGTNHSCTILLTDSEGSMLDSKTVKFTTEEGCIYCPAGTCTCNCKPEELEGLDDINCKEDKKEEYINPFWQPQIIIIEACNYCWITNSFTNPFNFAFMAVMSLLALGMIKMLCGHICCKARDGRSIDVVGVLLGTTSEKHTYKKQRSVTFQFLLGACFFLYLPLLPLIILFCGWRRRRMAKKRLKMKADRKRERLLKKKQEVAAAMQGVLVTGLVGEENVISLDEALKAEKDRAKFKRNLPKLLVVSTSSDTDEQDFSYRTDNETDIGDIISEDEEFIMEKHPNYRNRNKKKKKRK